MSERFNVLAIKENGYIIYDYDLDENRISDFQVSDKTFLIPETQNESIKGFQYDGFCIFLKEWVQYKVKSINSMEYKLTKGDFSKCGVFGDSSFGFLQFKNQIGFSSFKGINLKIESDKITESEEKELFETINSYISNLTFDFQKPTFSSVTRIRSQVSDIPYHKFLLIIKKLKDGTIQSNFKLIQKNPYKALTIKSRVSGLEEIVYYDEDSMVDFMSSPSQIIPCHNLNRSFFPKKLKKGNSIFLPAKLEINELVDSFDNPENQFLKFLFEFISRLLSSYQKKLSALDFCDNKMLNLCSQYKNEIDEILSSTFLKYVGRLKMIPFSSTVLTKQEGYRQLFSFFVGINSLPVYDSFQQSLNDIIDNKSLDVLYENYCFFGFADMLCRIYGVPKEKIPFRVLQTDFSKTLEKKTNSNYFSFPQTGSLPRVELHYNKNYCSPNSYSKSFDPDISIEIFNKENKLICIYVFDAKFKVSVFDSDTTDKDTPDYEVRTYKFDDICKMHAYRDALKHAKGAFVLYPGIVDKIFQEDNNESKGLLSGVGAFHIRPGKENDFLQLQPIVKTLLEINYQNIGNVIT